MFIDLHEIRGGDLTSVNPLLITHLRTGFGHDDGGTRVFFGPEDYVVVTESRGDIKLMIRQMALDTAREALYMARQLHDDGLLDELLP